MLLFAAPLSRYATRRLRAGRAAYVTPCHILNHNETTNEHRRTEQNRSRHTARKMSEHALFICAEGARWRTGCAYESC